jgi:hypothetical protein
MANELRPDIPDGMRKVQLRFEQWRSAHTGRLPIPERLWWAATELAREHGVFHTAKALHLDYGKLKQLLEAASPGVKGQVKRAPVSRWGRARSTAPPTFVELRAPRSGSFLECRVELEGPRGRMRIELKGIATAELVALRRALWDGEA